MRRRACATWVWSLGAAVATAATPGARAWANASGAEAQGGWVQDWFIFLERGRAAPSEQLEAMQRAHIDNFKRLFGLGSLLAAGPLQDPTGHKRGIVVARASTRAALDGLFVPDDYVRGGHMTLNAVPCLPRRALQTVGIVPENIEEVRIVMIGRVAPEAATSDQRTAQLQTWVQRGRVGAWYTLAQGPIAEVLFLSPAQAAELETDLGAWPGTEGATSRPQVWPQWLSKGVLPA